MRRQAIVEEEIRHNRELAEKTKQMLKPTKDQLASEAALKARQYIAGTRHALQFNSYKKFIEAIPMGVKYN